MHPNSNIKMIPCGQCGLLLGVTTLICPHCGLRVEHKGANVPSVTSLRQQQSGVCSQGITTPIFAGFWRRSCAFFIDILFVAILTIPTMSMVPIFPSILAGWLYSALMESSGWQATLGKRAAGIIVTDVNGVRLSFGRSSVRYFAKFLTTATLGVGFLMVLWTKNRQCLHDMVSGCLVYRRF